jgi:hypothetical protein
MSTFTRSALTLTAVPALALSAVALTTAAAPDADALVTPYVNTDGMDPAYINVDSVRAWAFDVAGSDRDRLAANCWTLPPSYTDSRYADSGRIAAALDDPPIDAQDGYVWGAGTDTEIRVPWNEGQSGYACPLVNLDGDHSTPDELVTLTATRFLLRETGTPLRPEDASDDAYPLRCAYTQDPVDPAAVAAADPWALAISGDTFHGWNVSNNGTDIDMRMENGRLCVAGVA